MKKSHLALRAAVAAAILTAAGLLVAINAGAQGPGGGRRKTELFAGRQVAAGQVLVKFRDESPAGLAQVRREADAVEERSVGRAGARLLRSRSKSTATLVSELSRRPDVLYAEPDYIIRPSAVPNDPRFAELWGLQNTGQPAGSPAPGVAGADIDAVSAWDVSTGSRDNVVAVVDTGVDYTHPDLAANMWSAPSAFTVQIGGREIRCAAGTHGFNAITKSCDPADEYDHGTHVAGTIGAAGNNGAGGVGINWAASIMDIKFIDASGSGTLSDALDAIEFAIQAKRALGPGANVRVLNNSWGWNGEPSQALLDQINLARESEMLFVAGAGNGGADRVGDDNDTGDAPFYPASYDAPNLLAVAATDNNDALASFSNYGASRIHLGAPGVLVFSTIKGGLYDWWSGTSMATPHVSGAAALVLARCSLDTAALKSALLNNVDPVASLAGRTSTGGRLNVNKAVRSCADLSEPANSWPAVELTQPREGDSFAVPAVVAIMAEATDGDGHVTAVNFYAGAELVGTDTTSPYSTEWYAPRAGTYTVTAVAVDDRGAATTSRPANVVINETIIPDPTPSPTPTVEPTPGPTPTPEPAPSPTPAQRLNVALSANGGVATASSTTSQWESPGMNFSPAGVIDGDRKGLNWEHGGGWRDGTDSAYPDWLQVEFPGHVAVDEVNVFTIQDAYASPAEPTEWLTFSNYGVTAFDVQYWDGSRWATVPGGSVTANRQVWRRFTLAPVTTPKVRVRVNNALAGRSRLVEVEVWGTPAPTPTPTPTPRQQTNVALSANGGVATASSTTSQWESPGMDFSPAGVIDGDRKGLNWEHGGGWRDGTAGYPDWIQVDFAGSKSIGEISVFTIQDNYQSPSEPFDEQTFSLYGVTAFDVQYWDGSQWVTVPGGSVRGNNLVWRKLTFTPVTTSRIRVVVNNALAGRSRLIEVEARESAGSPPPPSPSPTPTPRPRKNAALAANGGVATASSDTAAWEGIGTFPVSSLIDGDRKGLNWERGGGWRDGTDSAYPDWIQVDFSGPKVIDEVNVFTIQDAYASPAEPTEWLTFSNYGVTAFEVQYWDGSQWATVPGGSVTGNDKVWRKVTFQAVTTTKVRVVVNSALAGRSRLIEVEALEVD